MLSSGIKTYVEQRKGEHPDVLAAYDLQCEIERLERSLAEYREEYDEIMGRLARDGIKGKFFNITELRPRREVDVDYVRENLPDAFDQCGTLTNAGIIDILESTTGDGKRGIVRMMKRLSPSKFNELVRINVGDLEKYLGKKVLAGLEGKAVKTVYHPSSKTKILYIGDKLAVGAGNNEPQEALSE